MTRIEEGGAAKGKFIPWISLGIFYHKNHQEMKLTDFPWVPLRFHSTEL